MEKMITLPERNEMANRLVAFDGSGHMVRNLYPRLLAQAGASMPPMGFFMFVALAVDDYARSVNAGDVAGAMLRTTMAMRQQAIARALIDNEAALNEVLDLYEASGLPTGRKKDHG